MLMTIHLYCCALSTSTPAAVVPSRAGPTRKEHNRTEQFIESPIKRTNERRKKVALLLFWMTGRHLSNEARRGKEKEEDDVDAFAKKGQRTTMDVTNVT